MAAQLRHFVLSTHAPLHSTCPSGQVHAPAEHVWPPVHRRSQAPQKSVFVRVFTQARLHAVRPDAQEVAQVPWLQNGVLSLH